MARASELEGLWDGGLVQTQLGVKCQCPELAWELQGSVCALDGCRQAPQTLSLCDLGARTAAQRLGCVWPSSHSCLTWRAQPDTRVQRPKPAC